MTGHRFFSIKASPAFGFRTLIRQQPVQTKSES